MGHMRIAVVRRIASWTGVALWSLFAFYHGLLAIGSSLPLPPSIAGAVFYALTLCAMSAWPRASLLRVGAWTLLGASLPELVSTAATHVPMPSRWIVETAAVIGALFPVVLERARFRRAASLGHPEGGARPMRAPVERELRPAGRAEPERVVIDQIPTVRGPSALVTAE